MRVSDSATLAEPPVAGIGHNRPPVPELFREQYAWLIAEVEALAAQANKARDELEEDRVANDNERDTFVAIGVAAGKLIRKIEERREETLAPLRDEIAQWNALFGTDKPVQGSLKYRCNLMRTFATQVTGAYDAAKREEARRKAAEEAERARLEAQKKLEEAASSGEGVIADVALQEAERAEHKARHLEAQAFGAASGPTRTDAGTVSHVTTWDFRVTDAGKIDLNGPLRAHIKIDVIEKAIRAHVLANRDTVPIAGVEIFQTTKAQLR